MSLIRSDRRAHAGHRTGGRHAAHTDLSAHRGPVDTDSAGSAGSAGSADAADTAPTAGSTASGTVDAGTAVAASQWRPIVDHDDAARFPHACEPNEDGEYIDEYDPPRPSRRRLVGLDVARGIALIGMIAIHTMTSDDGDGNMSLAWILALGKASALFAVLSGVGLAFITGRRAVPRGWLAPRMSLVTVVRGTVVLLIGLLLGAFVPGAEVMVVLPYLGVMFIVAGLLVSLRTRTLLVIGFAWTIIGPVISHLVRAGLPPTVDNPTNLTLASLASPIDTFTVIFFTGSFPVITWMAYVCIGMALGRSNLAARSTIGLMTVGGLVLTLGTVLLSQFFVHGAGLYERLAFDVSDRMSLDTFTDFVVFGSSGQLPADSWWWLAVNAPHTGTPLDLLYTIGISLAVIGACLALTNVFSGRFSLLAVPGSMTLTMYALHSLLVGPMSELPDLLIFGLHVVGLTVLALAWAQFFQRGPLEEIVARITNLVRPTRNSRIYARGGAYKPNGQVVA